MSDKITMSDVDSLFERELYDDELRRMEESGKREQEGQIWGATAGGTVNYELMSEFMSYYTEAVRKQLNAQRPKLQDSLQLAELEKLRAEVRRKSLYGHGLPLKVVAIDEAETFDYWPEPERPKQKGPEPRGSGNRKWWSWGGKK